jgi:methyl-accepting chemotaxis protein
MASEPTQSLTSKYGIDPADLATRLEWLQLTADDLTLIRNAGAYLAPQAEAIVSEFYDHSFSFPDFQATVRQAGSARAGLEAAQAGYLRMLLSGRVDDAYMERMLLIGERHAELDVRPRWNVGNYATYTNIIFPRIAAHLDGQELVATLMAFQKIFMLDISTAVEAYVGVALDRFIAIDGELGPATKVLSEGVSQVDSAAKEITEAVQQIATGATEQAHGLIQATESSQSMREMLAEVATTSETAGERSATSLAAAEDGQQMAQRSVEAMETINEAVVSTASQIETLSESGKEIGAITQTISEIADQTNLLALNAAIEAARAGDAGRGFAVVADEVRSLAERSSGAAKDIASLIEKVQQGVERSVDSMKAVVTDVETGAGQARETGGVLERIVESSITLSELIGSIHELTSNADDMSGELSELMTGVGAVSEETAASAEQVSASTEEVTAQIGEMAERSERLAQLAAELSQYLSWLGAIEGDEGTQAA